MARTNKRKRIEGPIAFAPVERVSLLKIKPAKYNPRKISASQLEKLRRSMREFSAVEPLVWNRRTGNLVGGHQRLKVLLADGAKEADTCVVDLSPGKEKALNLALNRIAGEWDIPKLEDLLSGLRPIDLDLTGFELPELESLLPEKLKEGLADEDHVPEKPKKAVTKAGDIWTLGQHRLLCGDATVAATFEVLMMGKVSDLILTDPPYGVNYDGGAVKRKTMVNDNILIHKEFLPIARRHSADNAALYLWYADNNTRGVFDAIEGAQYKVRRVLIWNKNQAQFGAFSAQYKQKHESCLYCHKYGKIPAWFGPTNEVTVWDIARLTVNPYHPTQKPVDLCVRPIKNSCKIGGIVLDCFAGSGSILIASEKSDRKCMALELNPGYCDVIVDRWQQFTGGKAKRQKA